MGGTNAAGHGQATLSGIKHVDTTQLRDYKMLVQPNNEVPRVIPGECFELDDNEQIRSVALAHTRYRGEGLPEWLWEELGGSYTERWLPFRQETLVAACEFAGIPYPVAEPRDGDDPTGSTASVSRQPLPGETTPLGENTQPAGPLPAHAGTGTLPAVTATTNPREAFTAYQDATQRLQEVMAETREYPLGKTFTFIYQAFAARNAPQFAPLDRLVLAAELVSPDASDEEFQAVLDKARKHLDHYGVPAATGDGVPVADFPVYAKPDVLAAWEHAKTQFLADQAELRRKSDPVLAALDGLGSEWIVVSVLGRLVGRIVSGDVREQARQFSAELREKYGLGEDAFKRTNAGTAVSVGAIQAAATAALAA